MILRTRGWFASLTSIPSMQLLDVFFQGGDDVLCTSNSFIEGLSSVEAAPYFSRFGGVGSRFRLRYPYQLASGFIRIQGRFDCIQLWSGFTVNGDRMGLTSGSRSRSTGRLRKPRPWKSEVQFLEMNFRVQVPSVSQTRIDVSGGGKGGPAADSWWLSGSVGSGWGGLLMEHFLMKSAFRVSTSSAMLASVLSKAGWSV